MALRPIPSGVGASDFTIRDFRFQIVQTSAFTGTQQVINRGPSVWEGTLNLPLVKDTQKAREVSAWLTSLDGAAHHTHIDGNLISKLNPTFTHSSGPNWVVTSIDANEFVRVDSTINARDFVRVFAVGNYLSVASRDNPEITRTFIVGDVNGPLRQFCAYPKGVLQPGDIISSNPVLSVNFTGSTARPGSTYGVDFNGPWALQWREVIG